MAAETEDAEDVLEQVLRPAERVLWISQPDRALWQRALTWGLGVLPFTAFLVALLASTLLLGAAAVSRAKAHGAVPLDVALPAIIGGLILGIFVYPMITAEISRRERRYVITSERALVLDAKRVESDVELARVKLVALHKGLFDDTPTGVELRSGDGTAAVVFRDLADPGSIRASVEGAIAAARSE